MSVLIENEEGKVTGDLSEGLELSRTDLPGMGAEWWREDATSRSQGNVCLSEVAEVSTPFLPPPLSQISARGLRDTGGALTRPY